MVIVTNLRHRAQLCHHALIPASECITLHGRRTEAELRLSLSWILFKLDVFLVDARKNERHAGHTARNIFLCRAVVTERALLQNPENRQVILAQR